MDSRTDVESLFGDPVNASVERAISEFRAGRPIVIVDGHQALVATGVEALEPALASALGRLGPAHLVLPPARLRRLGVERAAPGMIALPAVDLARVETLALKIDARIDAPVGPAGPLDAVALELASLSLLLPAVIAVPLNAGSAPAGLLSVEAEAVRCYRRGLARTIKIVSRAPVPLDGAPETEFVVFRGGEGLRDQVAIIVGTPDFAKPVPVRLHSACLTGDLFGSLKCDCGDQLRGTVRFMAENGGGVLLYLDQEGRGNGIANKMRAYQLQSQGWDTYDADEVLGFGFDQRRFDFAAEMLKLLGVAQVAVYTNNPLKIAALQRAGLDVVEDRRAYGRQTAENVLYLASKRDRAGHYIDFDDLAAHLPIQD
ncbi:GTP cyclohydrolase II RibA [Alsobacter sp. KACC 23698]|uniref:GTP cyclohydrolase-2 n=1 Tax=Alsobacter sp. KACC 23698 TaxID=3149229 RepID=A0AAU7J9I3_9HYPH